MKPCVIESPYAGNVAENEAYLGKCISWCIDRQMTPYASHAILTRALDDTIAEQRERGLLAGRDFTEQLLANGAAWFVFIDLGVSPGMRQSIAYHRAQGHEPQLVMLELYNDLPQSAPAVLSVPHIAPHVSSAVIPPLKEWDPLDSQMGLGRVAVRKVLETVPRPFEFTAASIQTRFEALHQFPAWVISRALREFATEEPSLLQRASAKAGTSVRWLAADAPAAAPERDAAAQPPPAPVSVPEADTLSTGTPRQLHPQLKRPAPIPASPNQMRERVILLLRSCDGLDNVTRPTAARLIMGRECTIQECDMLKKALNCSKSRRLWQFNATFNKQGTEFWTLVGNRKAS